MTGTYHLVEYYDYVDSLGKNIDTRMQ